MLALVLSAGHWLALAYPRQYWKDPPPPERTERPNDFCPDGMATQIELFATWYRGDLEAGRDLLHWLRHSHQSSTLLVGVIAGGFSALGLPAHFSFALLSALASVLLTAILWRMWGDSSASSLRLVALYAFLLHPATFRCLVRPQTDALVALSLVLGPFLVVRSVRRGVSAMDPWLLALSQSAAMFVKIHAVSFAVLPAICAFAIGQRGRTWMRTVVFGTFVPLAVWVLVFGSFGLWNSIPKAWATKETFYQSWDVLSVLRNLWPTVLPLLLSIALCARRPGLEARCASWIAFFYAAILVGCGIPPFMRFVYPALGPLMVLAVSGTEERPLPGWKKSSWSVLVLAPVIITLGLCVVLFYNRYLGPVRDLDPWSSRLYTFV